MLNERINEIVAPIFGPIRSTDPNWFRDIRLILFIYLFIFQKCRDPNPCPDPNGGSEPEAGLLLPFSFTLSKTFYLCLFILEFSITWKYFKW